MSSRSTRSRQRMAATAELTTEPVSLTTEVLRLHLQKANLVTTDRRLQLVHRLQQFLASNPPTPNPGWDRPGPSTTNTTS